MNEWEFQSPENFFLYFLFISSIFDLHMGMNDELNNNIQLLLDWSEWKMMTEVNLSSG